MLGYEGQGRNQGGRKDGWKLDRTRGSHRQFVHPVKPGAVTIAGHLSDEVPQGTLASILRQAGLKKGSK